MMSNSRKEFLEQAGSGILLILLGLLGLKNLGCADKYRCIANGESTVLELAVSQIGGCKTIIYSGSRGVYGSYIYELGGYDPSEENRDAGWIFEVNGRMPDDEDTNAATYVPEAGTTVMWQVA